MSSESFLFNLAKQNFAQSLLLWQRQHGRHDLPWQQRDPYLIWVSEIMLQQTQVSTVLDYYPRFIDRFGDVKSLAHAHIDEVTALWAGLGYYSRARHLHHAAQQIVTEFNGKFPEQREQLQQLKGVGRSTAAAICAFAFDAKETILDGNVKRVLCRIFEQYGDPQNKQFENQLWDLAESLLPPNPKDMPAYTQGLMDLGATVCKRTKPKCDLCPMQTMCQAYAKNLTDVLPQRKKPTSVIKLNLHWLCLINDNDEIWLERRPQTGIWSQLYCTPTVEAEVWSTWLIEQHLQDQNFIQLATIKHKLTHRDMSITPFVLRLHDKFVPSAMPGAFYSLQDTLNLGLPKPLQQHLPQIIKSDLL